jgi:hypothetical protein
MATLWLATRALAHPSVVRSLRLRPCRTLSERIGAAATKFTSESLLLGVDVFALTCLSGVATAYGSTFIPELAEPGGAVVQAALMMGTMGGVFAVGSLLAVLVPIYRTWRAWEHLWTSDSGAVQVLSLLLGAKGGGRL